jgi:DUF1009 family protein
VERRLALMAAAGALPARAASEARRQGWRVTAFAFDDAPALAAECDAVIASRLTDIQAVLSELGRREITAAVFVGKFWKEAALQAAADGADAAATKLSAGGLSDAALAEAVVMTLGALGVEVLDPRRFLGPWLLSDRWLADAARVAPPPTEDEREEIRAGLALARHLAGRGVGQTVVRARGVTVAVEAAEGTDEAIRRGTRLAGPGAVVVKAVAPEHDYRFDVPAIGPATLEAMAAGRARVLAVDADTILLVDGEAVLARAAAAGIAVVGVTAPAHD